MPISPYIHIDMRVEIFLKKLNIGDKLAEKNVLIQRKEERLRDGGSRRQQKAI